MIDPAWWLNDRYNIHTEEDFKITFLDLQKRNLIIKYIMCPIYHHSFMETHYDLLSLKVFFCQMCVELLLHFSYFKTGPNVICRVNGKLCGWQ